MRRLQLTLILVLCSVCVHADQTFPKPGWKDGPDPLTSPDAVRGGELSFFLGQEANSDNAYFSQFSHTGLMFGLMYETLLSSDSLTAIETPNLAKKWSISDDMKTYTFWLDERARWSDGKPITAHDVKATFDMAMRSSRVKMYKMILGRFESPVVENDYKVVFKVKSVHWSNLGSLGGFEILPKHMIENPKYNPAAKEPAEDAKYDSVFNKLDYRFPVTSGPYVLGKKKPGQFTIFERNRTWWQKDFLRNRHVLNFDKLKFVFYGSRLNAMEAFNKGQTDVHAVYTSSIWAQKAVGNAYDKNWIVKQRIHNYNPTGFQGWAINMRREKFKDKRVRKALCHLLNRELMNERLMFNVYTMHKSFFEDLWSPKKPCPNEYIKYDVEAARKLLREAGWKVNPATGKLEKDGKPFVIHFLGRDSYVNKFLDIYREDLKKAGIELKVDIKDLAAWQKDMETFNYDVTWSAWGAGVRKDPEYKWYSKEADREGGQNTPGFKNAEVDRLIEKQRTMLDMEARHKLVRKIDQIAYKEYPYMLLWYIDNTRLLYWNKFGMPEWVLGKYGTEYSVISYWWLDEDAEQDLKDAMENNEALPKQPVDVYFDKTFKQ